MAVVIADIATQLQGVRNPTLDGYYFFKYYEIYDTVIQEYLDQSLAWCNAQIDTATQTANPSLYDYLVQNYTCMRLVAEQMMMMVMEVGVSYEDLETRMDKKNFPEDLMNALDQYVMRVREFFNLLRNRVEFMQPVTYGVDPNQVWEYNYRSTATWGRGG